MRFGSLDNLPGGAFDENDIREKNDGRFSCVHLLMFFSVLALRVPRPEICPPYPLAPVPLRGGALVALWSELGKPPARSRASPCRRPLPPRFRGRSRQLGGLRPYTPQDLDAPPLPNAPTGRPLRARPVWPLPFACGGSTTCGEGALGPAVAGACARLRQAPPSPFTPSRLAR